MLNSCNHALSQGDGNDFNPWCNWEATPTGYRACVRAWIWVAPCHRATPAQIPGQLSKAGKNARILAAVANCGRSRKWCGRGRLALGFKLRCGSLEASFWDHTALVSFWGPCSSLGREEARTSISFPAIQYPGLGRGGRKDCVFVGILKDFGISMKTLSYYS